MGVCYLTSCNLSGRAVKKLSRTITASRHASCDTPRIDFFAEVCRPTATLAALAAAGVIVGIVGLGITQVLVGRGETDRMAVAWLVAVAAAAIAIVVVQSDPTIRVVAGFLTGEVVALAGLTASTLIRPGQQLSPSESKASR